MAAKEYWYASYLIIIPGCPPNYYSRIMDFHPLDHITKHNNNDRVNTLLMYSCQIDWHRYNTTTDIEKL